jgi:glucose dehydrogenase
MRSAATLLVAIGALLSTLVAQRLSTEQATGRSGADWPMYRHDYAGTGFSPLTEIGVGNVARLTQAWTVSLDAGSSQAGGGRANALSSQATPIVVEGRMYVPTADGVVALDPDTGKEVWRYRMAGAAPSRRGVAYWPGESGLGPRIVFTAGRRLIVLNANTGAIESAFGQQGEVDLVVPYNSVPLVFRTVVVVGANSPPGSPGGIGNPRAFDVRTGAKLWEFNSVPLPGETGHETWEGDSWKGRLGVNAWPFYFTADETRGLLYVPLASPIGGAYGGDRKGANLFGNSVVALDVQTGRYRWHFQTIHHDLWDADPPAPPGLIDITQNGRTVPALALTTKSGYLYVLNRETGQPIFGVTERPVAQSDVPGEQTSATQPIPVKPPPIARVAYTDADLVTAADTSPEHARACAELVAGLGGVENRGPFSPWRYRADGAASKVSLVFPGGTGGANWGGTASDAGLGFVFVATQDLGALGWVEKAREGARFPYVRSAPERQGPGRGNFDVAMSGGNWPCQKPPWGRLTAVNMATGDFAWQVPLGVTDQLPEGKQRTGRPGVAGPIATAGGVLFIASTDDNRFRAFNARTGAELWTTRLEQRGNADPITYQGASGRQYVVIVTTDRVMAYALGR